MIENVKEWSNSTDFVVGKLLNTINRASDISCGRGAAKFTKTRKIPWNAVEILSNTCLYSNFETCLSYWGYLLAVNSQIYVKTSSLKRANNVPKLPGVDYVAKNWALAMMLKALPLVHFWSVLLLKEQMMTSVRKTLKTLVWSTQNRSISSEICPEKTHKIRRFFTDCFPAKFVPKIPAKSADFSPILSLKIPRNLTFFRDLSEALNKCWNHGETHSQPCDLPVYMFCGVEIQTEW